jgi:hypothetical protein
MMTVMMMLFVADLLCWAFVGGSLIGYGVSWLFVRIR